MSAGLQVLKALATGCTITMFLSSVPAIRHIDKAHDTDDVALFPLVGLWLNCHMAMLYGVVTANYFPFFSTFALGTLLSMVCLGVYFRWTTARSCATKAIGAAFVAVAMCSVYTILGLTGITGQPADKVANVVGYIVTLASLLPYVGPFETIKTVVKTRSGASIPVGMCLAGATANGIWTVYGLIIDDMFVYINGGACMAVGLVQVALYVIFWPVQKSVPSLSEASSLSDNFVLPVKMTAPKSLDTANVGPMISPTCSDKLDDTSPTFVQICSP
ncbi:hypothetical protein PF010_g7822 [Phytophthora fragariae]|uniref:Bidirectional sugar transporter SWEET n=1 Tax=Phytophthora fragariae TaxID=53985 RepID=A0A6A3L953_9STRA|nr:hypothetical protein PF011_g7391 [Phytophthora fragariae]KAE9119568.1 hypothetical protein PF010_g7822 [Phytophthora fragariae]KAE9240410.1 hypothetical protein PF004_g7515 [Phytophthora fragariae]